ncbi:glycerol-3-phosphate acyltransferase 3 [Tripterygium wilfordii]|uniref:Glycerol-3-phosphate acyltransferase 3 n=1 Tax=Tripterygium wilfordii TaxID=458696 RepID=A0A7J7D0W3_TRIWF|nr:probable glycerol-3-phosphate acyltransferase 3 [Tripterygium wilfordii]KAF5739974.1 glycerol-3-phosphate acyltransferase 3 [Tripterygium wilfordii]
MPRKAIFNTRAPLIMLKILCTKICNQLYLPKKPNNNYTQNLLPFPSNLKESSTTPNQTLVFGLERVLLKSCSIFPYFMLVAFEAGGPLRALVLLLLYPFVCLAGEELGLKIMVFVCFVGIKADSFRAGRAVLPKFFLENVGKQGFDMVMKWERKVGLTNMPRVMVEGFLREYLGIEDVLGRELKLCCGFFVGLMEEKREQFGMEKMDPHHVIGLIGSNTKSFGHELTSLCKAIYLVSEAEKRTWEVLPREKYPKPLIFHDGRLAFMPTPLASLALFMWIPFGSFLFIIRSIVGILLPYKLSIPILSFTGMQGILLNPKSSFNFSTTPSQKPSKPKGRLYVCNHRTLLDPLFVSAALMKPLTAVTYSLSKVVESFSPIKTIRLTRNRDTDSKKMKELLSQGDLVVCPEGTTCREPYLLRFSPLFAELSDEIVPIALDFQVSMLYGTTAGGLKCLDPVLLLMNPTTICCVKVLDELPRQFKVGKSKFEVANHVQSQISKALDFECTSFTRKDKYMLLAGNEGIVKL